MTTKKIYIGKDGTEYPLYEAKYPTAFRVFQKDEKKAIQQDGHECIEAKGLCRQRNVIEAHVGSGRIATVAYRGDPEHEDPIMQTDHAVRYLIRAKAARVRDAFDTNKELKDQTLMLDAVPPALSSKKQKEKQNKRAEEIKSGAPVRKYKKTGATSRAGRIGVRPRKRALIKVA